MNSGTIHPPPVVSCAACGAESDGAVFTARSAVGASIGRYRACGCCATLTVMEVVNYESLYKDRESGNYAGARGGPISKVLASMKKAYLRTVAWKFVERKSRSLAILDFGCGSGELANALASAGCRRVVAADVQIERPISLESEISYVPLPDIPSLAPYETILLRHVLEHVSEPAETLTDLAGCLTPTGRLVVEVPNSDSIFRYLLRSHWPGYYFPYHVCVFSEAGLRAVANRSGMAVERLTRCNPPILGTVFLGFGVPQSIARLLAITFYPVQLTINLLTRRSEAMRATLVPRA